MATLATWSGRRSELTAGLPLRRVLPSATRRAVGPFVFFDHFGPVVLPPGRASDVPPHPHIGLATVTYLFEGRQVHRDSLGTVQTIEAGAVNWMSAGRGIVHSERAHADDVDAERPAHGLQLWVALPPQAQDSEPSFQHLEAAQVPICRLPGGAEARVLVGSAWGASSPVRTASPTLYLDLQLPAGAGLELPVLAAEAALYAPSTGFSLDGQPVGAQEMVLLPPAPVQLQAGAGPLRVLLVGGDALLQPVRLWWNFVSADRARLAAAAARWQAGGFDPIPGETGRVEAPVWRD
ncbi:hypothetical protein CLD22_21105 [Rubrivivax gelatinosus]|nr:hypothetical protein [Rubrivivax gelatinosus]